MRKHNKQMATRCGRNPGTSMSHKLVNDKQFQLGVNGLLCKLIKKGAM